MTEEKLQRLQETGLIEWLVFSELVAMDEDEEDFSKGLFRTFVDQFEETFSEFDENIQSEDLEKISSLGHYLKGSAAALGLTTISEQCERIQNYGHKIEFETDDKTEDKDDLKQLNSYWIALIEDAMEKAKDGFQKSKAALSDYFDDEL